MRASLLIATFLFLTSCHLRDQYEIPPTAVPTAWKGATGEIIAMPQVENWWEIFQDELLNKLEHHVLENNPNLFAGLERVVEARAQAGIKEADLWPELNVGVAKQRWNERISKEQYGISVPDLNPEILGNRIDIPQIAGVPEKIVSLLTPFTKKFVRIHPQQYLLPVTMKYEMDLWGKYRGQIKSAKIYVQAQEESVRTVKLVLTAELASHYFNLRATDTQLSLLGHSIELKKKALELNRSQFRAGVINSLYIMNAERLLKAAEAEYQETERQRTIFENAIASLLGMPASNFQVKPYPLTQEPPLIPADIPSSVVLRRPDVAEAERNMASVHALIGAAYATLLPSLNLTATLGFESPQLKDWLEWKNRLWQFGLDFMENLFDGKKRISNIRIAKARFNEAKRLYEKAVIASFQEVEDALNNVESYRNQYDNYQSSFNTARQTNTLSHLRYKKGVTNLLEALESEKAEIDAKRAWMNALALRYQSTIQLVKAIGGGWDAPQ